MDDAPSIVGFARPGDDRLTASALYRAVLLAFALLTFKILVEELWIHPMEAVARR